MADPFYELTADGARMLFDVRVGNIRRLEFTRDGRTIEPLHTAPWVDDPEVLANDALAAVEQRLSGDFFCAPFGLSDVETAPLHGWSANSAWELLGGDTTGARFRLQRSVMGSGIEKEIRLHDGSPVLYQTHTVSGGHDGLTVAHHPMTRMAAGGVLSFSLKALAMTPAVPLEPGRHRLAYPATAVDLAQFPAADGGVFDLHRYPTEVGHEDFVVLIEASDAALGWTAVVREVEDDIVFVLKDPRVLPTTMLWMSNGGRDHTPWNGRHVGVLGIEDGCAAGAAGHAAALTANEIGARGVATALPLRPDGKHVIRHVIGAVARPSGWQSVGDITIENGRLVIRERGGSEIAVSFDSGFFGADQR